MNTKTLSQLEDKYIEKKVLQKETDMKVRLQIL